jgi:hypothetical protein
MCPASSSSVQRRGHDRLGAELLVADVRANAKEVTDARTDGK